MLERNQTRLVINHLIKKKSIAVETEKKQNRSLNHIRILIDFEFKNKLCKLLLNLFLSCLYDFITDSNFYDFINRL